MLGSITNPAAFADVQNSSSNNVSVLNKSDEAIKTNDKKIEINSQDSEAQHNNVLYINKINLMTYALYNKGMYLN
jgi:hypothetical protein